MVDLLLGSDLGLWALDCVDHDTIQHVITLDSQIAEKANSMDLSVLVGNVNQLNYSPSSFGLSVHYPRLLKNGILSRYEVVYNLHPGYLPWGRGYYPVFWALWENSPAGCTLHEINEEIDEGAIVDQTSVEIAEGDTGWTLFNRVRHAEKALFLKYWPEISRGTRLPTCTPQLGGSYHSRQDFFDLKTSSDWHKWTGEKLIHLIRCLTIPHYPGWEVKIGDTRFELKLQTLA